MVIPDIVLTSLLNAFLPVGGLTAVIFTDVLQCAIMIIGAIVLSILSEYNDFEGVPLYLTTISPKSRSRGRGQVGQITPLSYPISLYPLPRKHIPSLPIFSVIYISPSTTCLFAIKSNTSERRGEK